MQRITEPFKKLYAAAQAAQDPLSATAILSWVPQSYPMSARARFVRCDPDSWLFERMPGMGFELSDAVQPVAVCFFWETLKAQVCIEGQLRLQEELLRVDPDRVEFWHDRAFRLHERTVYVCEQGRWTCEKLYP